MLQKNCFQKPQKHQEILDLFKIQFYTQIFTLVANKNKHFTLYANNKDCVYWINIWKQNTYAKIYNFLSRNAYLFKN